MSIPLHAVKPEDSSGENPSFSELLKSELAAQALTKCRSCRWYSALDDDAKRAFDECAAAGPPGYIVALWNAAQKMGLDVAYSTFKDHMSDHHHKRKR